MASPTALASATSSPATAGAFQDALGNVLANGTLTFDLSQAAAVSGGGEVVPRRVVITLDANGKVSANQSMYRNTDLSPSGTTYQMRTWDSTGNFVGNFGPQVISGAAPIDLALLTPTRSSGTTVGFANAVLQNPSAAQTITGFGLTLTSSSPLTVQGNETVGGTFGVTGVSTLSGGVSTPSITGPGFQKQIFTSSGTFTISSGITQVKVTAVGGGGSGGTGNGSSTCGTGGGSGSAAIKWLTGLTPGNTLTVTVGSGGAGVTSASTNGNNGTGSTVISGTQTITSILTDGGLGGDGNVNNNHGGQGGSIGTGGDFNFAGNPGIPCFGTSSMGTPGGASIFGGAGQEGLPSANAGAAPGAGGGGSSSGGGTGSGAGANGIVIFEWVN